MLNEEVCLRCINEIARKSNSEVPNMKGYIDTIIEQRGYFLCPVRRGRVRTGGYVRTSKELKESQLTWQSNPPSWCPYLTEHVVSQEE